MPDEDFSQFADSAERSAELVGFDPNRAAGDRKIRKNLAQILALQFGNDASADGIEAKGETVIDLSASRLHRYVVTESVKFTLPNLTTPYVTDRGEFTLVISMGGPLRTVAFSHQFQATAESEDFDTKFKIYIVRCLIVNGFVIYEVKGHVYIQESEFTNTLYMVGDLGFDKGPGFGQSMTYLAGKQMNYLLYAGDVNYTAGSEKTFEENTELLNPLIAAKKVLAIHGNHDLQTVSLDFTQESLVFPFAGDWRFTSNNVFSSDWKFNAATSATWTTLVGEVGKVPGFGDNDSLLAEHDPAVVFYFTRVVNLSVAPAAGKVALIQMYIDDGARVVINGLEVYNFNLQHPVAGSSVAFYKIGDEESGIVWTERKLHRILVDATILQAGDNLIAAEIHQLSSGSTDMAWDMSLGIGTSTDVVPTKTEEVRFTNGYGQPLKNKLPYLENGMLCYQRTIPGVVSIYSLNDGLRSSQKNTNPWTIEKTGRMHQWLADRMAADPNPFKIVQIHRCCVSAVGGYWKAELDWPVLKHPGILLVYGHSHHANHYSHSTGQHAINASNSGSHEPRPLKPMMGITDGYTDVWSDASWQFSVCRIDVGPNFLRCRFENTFDGSLMHEFIMEKP